MACKDCHNSAPSSISNFIDLLMEFQLSYFKSSKMMLLKCCTQYASKFGKFSGGHRTGKCQGSFQSQRKAMPKNVQTTAQLHPFHMIAKFSKWGFNSMWTENFQMFKLDWEKAEEPEIKLPYIHWITEKPREFQKKTYFCFIDYPQTFDCVDHNKLWKIL